MATPPPHHGAEEAPRNVYVREDHLRDVLPGLLSQRGWERPEDAVALEIGEYLSSNGLEVVCGHGSWELKPTPHHVTAGPMFTPGQMSLGLEMNPIPKPWESRSVFRW